MKEENPKNIEELQLLVDELTKELDICKSELKNCKSELESCKSELESCKSELKNETIKHRKDYESYQESLKYSMDKSYDLRKALNTIQNIIDMAKVNK